MAASTGTTWKLVGAVTALKLMLIPSYHSTDFEVHRNWLALTHSLPPAKWYLEKTSEWTLDYPPLFAWFEYVLSLVAQYFDAKMLQVTNLNYASTATVLFQRLSVIASDFLLVYAVSEYSQHCLKKHPSSKTAQYSSVTTLPVLLLCNAGLFIVDHIHFQYNGFLFGWLILSITRICQGRYKEGALWFAVLLNFKHIYLYIAPAYFIYLLRCYCFKSKPDGGIIWTSFSPLRVIGLGLIVISVFGISFGPFIEMGQIQQVLSRLFPFKRGLCHAYWAPNFWALYNVFDKAAVVTGSRLQLVQNISTQQASMTGGLVQEFDHVILPSVKPIATFVCTFVSVLPALGHLWVYPGGSRGFIRSIVLCAFSSYVFGWHVHEKAILLIIIPLSLLAVEKKKDAQSFLMLSTTGHFSLFPLIFTQAENPIKYMLMLAFAVYAFISLSGLFESPRGPLNLPLLSMFESVYLLGLLPLEVYCNLLHYLLRLDQRLPFLPLLLTSCYCCVGVLYSWLVFYYHMLSQPRPKSKKTD